MPPTNPLDHAVKMAARAGVDLMEQRIASIMQLAGVTPDDLASGTAQIVRIAKRHSDCCGTGIKSAFHGGTTFTVAICPCLDIRITKRLTINAP